MATELSVPAEARVYIDRVIIQEGGWVLTSNDNDPDGGFTYAGVTARTFKSYCEQHNQPVITRENINVLLRRERLEASTVLKDLVYQIYFDEYYEPLFLSSISFRGKGPLLSCAVNLGLDDAVFVLQAALNSVARDALPPSENMLKVDGHLGTITYGRLTLLARNPLLKDHILREWMRRYINLVQLNSQAWKLYAEAIDFGQDEPVRKPEVLRAASLEGWFNRVEYWRF